MRNLPRFEGRQIKKQPDVTPEMGSIKIAPKGQDSLPKMEEQRTSIDNTPKDLFGKIKELFKIDRAPSKTTINNVTYNTKNVKNNSSTTPSSSDNSTINNSKNVTEQNKKISIFNTFLGKNPTMVKSERLFNSDSPKIERNVNSIENNLRLTENLWKNEHNRSQEQINNTENKYNIPTTTEETTNIKNNYTESNPSISSNNIKSSQNLNNIVNTQTNSEFYKTSVERKPYFYQSKKIKYVFSPKHEKSFISFAQGGMIQQAGNSVMVNQPTPIAMAGDKSSGVAEKVQVTPTSGPNSVDAAARATTQASNEKGSENKQEQAKEEATGGEPQMEGGNGGSAIVNNISNNITTKQMTTFEKVAIETAFLPNWRRIFG